MLRILYIAIVITAVAVMTIAIDPMALKFVKQPQQESTRHPLNNIHTIQEKTLTADLGGRKATIPIKYLGLLEFELRDPSPSITQPKSIELKKIGSFGFRLRPADMAVLDITTYPGHEGKTPANTDWIRVAINSNKQCLGCSKEGLANYYNVLLSKIPYNRNDIAYNAQPEKQFGLSVLLPEHIDGKLLGYKLGLDTGYYATDDKGRITTFIICSNAKYESAPCTHVASLYPDLALSIHLSYRRGLLGNWNFYEQSVKNLVYGFL